MEYEYSYRVTNIEEYINYCKKNNYKLIGIVKQTRIIYTNKNKTIARITIEDDGNITKKLDFKEDKLSKEDLIVRKESAALTFENDKDVENILDFLEYKKGKTIIRKRTIYEKDKVKFEIDEYEKPEICFVVAIEGEKEETDLVYNELESLNKIYKEEL